MYHFFYGTLMRDLPWNGLIRDQKFVGEAVCPYAEMYILPDTRSYPIPAMVWSPSPDSKVVGEVWDIVDREVQHLLWTFEREAGYSTVCRSVFLQQDGQRLFARCFVYPSGAITPRFLPVVGGDFRKYLQGEER